MAALLGEHLVLDLHPGGARTLERAHGAHRVDRIAEAGVGVGEHRHADHVADRRHLIGQFGERDEADVGNAERHVGDAGAGDVDRLEAEVLDHAGKQGIGRARQDRRILAREQRLEPSGGAF